MSDELLRYFEQEYAALMQLAGELPPGVARRLRISRDQVDDPHVERLLEGVAYLGARVQARLDDEFPELTDGLLNILYPQLLAPFPSCLIAQLVPKPGLQRLLRVAPFALAQTDKVDGAACRFRTTAAVVLWPVDIESVALASRPLPPLNNKLGAEAAGVLRISLRCLDRDMTFEKLAAGETTGLGRLRVQLRGAAAPALHELLCGHVVSVAFANVAADGGLDPHPFIRGREAITAGGLAAGDALIPWPPQGFAGFRLLAEYFALPEKLLCVDIDGIDGKALAGAGNRLDIVVYLDTIPPALERAVQADTLALGCVPMVNLFPRRCEPVDLDWTRTEYRVVADRAMPEAMEVWSVEEVRESRADGTSSALRKLFRQGVGDTQPGDTGAEAAAGGYLPVLRPAGGRIAGTETFLAIDLPRFDPATAPRSRLSVQALCTNRDLPAALPLLRSGPMLRLETGVDGVQDIVALTPATPTLRPPPRGQRAWQLISHLSMSHLALVNGGDGADTLRDVLRLYDLRNTAETRAAIAALVAVSARDGAARLPGVRPGVFCRGTDVTLTFAAQAWRGGALFNLAAVLAEFLRLHATVNSFVRTTVKLQGQADAAAAWPARAGTRDLV